MREPYYYGSQGSHSPKKTYLSNKQLQNLQKKINLRSNTITQKDGDVDTDLLNTQIEQLMVKVAVDKMERELEKQEQLAH